MNWAVAWQNQQNGMCAQQRLRSAWASAQSDQGCPGWSEFSLCAQWIAKESSFLHADSEDSDQTGRMPRLIWVFAGRTNHFVGFVVRRLNWPDAKWTITPPLIKIQDKQRLFSDHFIRDRKHMYWFVLGFFHRYVILTGQSNLSINFCVRLIAFLLLYCKLLVIMPYWGIGYVMISTSIIIWRCHILPWMPL